MFKLIQIQEQNLFRLLNIYDVCSAAKTDKTLFVFLVNSSDPIIFCGEPADIVWKILADASMTVYAAPSTDNKNADTPEASAESLEEKN